MHRVVLGFLPVLFLVSLVGTATAQAPTPAPAPPARPAPATAPTPAGPAPCPTVSVRAGSGRRTRDGEPVVFSANFAGGDPRVVPTIIWSTSAGVITRGQGTRQIEVDTTGAGSTPDRQVRAEIWVGGYAPGCVPQASGGVAIVPPTVKFGDFGEVDDATLKTNLEHVARYVSQSPDRLYVIAYAGRTSARGFAFNWLARIREGLVANGLASGRIVVLDGGFRETPMFDFWIVPLGSEPPRPTPTVKRSEIVYPSRRPARKPN
jgi:hypothetical protein